MKRYVLLLLALVLLTGGIIGMVALRPVAPAVVPPPVSRPAPVEPSAMKPIVAPPPTVPKPADEPAPTADANTSELPPLIVDEEKAKERIQLLTATSDEAYVPELARYLGHASPAVRAAARNALLLIDDASAVPYLRAAAEEAEKLAETTAEAALLRDAAEILTAPRPAGEVRPPKQPLANGASVQTRRAEIPITGESK